MNWWDIMIFKKFMERSFNNEFITAKDVLWNSDTLLVNVHDGLSKLTTVYHSDQNKYYHILVLDNAPLMDVQCNNYYCPTCEKLINNGYGLENSNSEYIKKVKFAQKETTNINDSVESLKPLLKLLRNGLYLISIIQMYPTDGEGHFFWTSKLDKKNKAYKTTMDYIVDYNYRTYECGYSYPNFIYPTQSLSQLNLNQVEYYREKIKDGKNMTALAYHMDGFMCALLDGHHRATAACLEGVPIYCLTIIPVSGYSSDKTFYAGGQSFNINNFKHTKTIRSALDKQFKSNKDKWQKSPYINTELQTETTNLQEHFKVQLDQKAKLFPDYHIQLYKGMFDDISFNRLNAIWNKSDLESQFEFEVILRVLYIENKNDIFKTLYKIVHDKSKHFIWELAYEFLSTYDSEDVEDIFIDYLVEYGEDKHSKINFIVNKYLNNR